MVIVCDTDGNVNVAWLSRITKNFLDEWRGYEMKNIAYWMPLPSPPITLPDPTLPPINLHTIGVAK
jgi:hypothetical protein